MPTYEIEQYEIHTQTYRVKAANEAEAIKKLWNGEATPVDGGLEYVEIAEDLGLPVDEYREIAHELHRLGEQIGEDIIPSIGSVSLVDTGHLDS
jgi:hypothetical protein